MRMDATPSRCEVLGCDEPATATYLHAVDKRLVEFSICGGHSARVERGERPVVAAERSDPADLAGRTVLVLGSPDDDESA